MVSCDNEKQHDGILVKKNGERYFEKVSNQGWLEYAAFIDMDQDMELEFFYEKNDEISEGTDNCFIDDIRFEFCCNRLTENCGLASE